MRKLGATGAAASAEAYDSFILAFSKTPMDKPMPEGNTALIALGETGASASAESRASLITEFSTAPIEKPLPAGKT